MEIACWGLEHRSPISGLCPPLCPRRLSRQLLVSLIQRAAHPTLSAKHWLPARSPEGLLPDVETGL